MKRMTATVILTTAVLAGCSSDTTPEEPAPQPTAETPDPTVEEPAEMQTSAELIEPGDEAAYLEGLRQREAERVDQFDEAELVDLGRTACELTDGYVNGTSPTPGDELLEEMVDRGHDPDLADAITADIRNAMDGTLCTIERTPAS